MLSIKKNIWLAFHAFTAIWISVLVFSVISTYKDVYRDHIVEAQNITAMSANSLGAVLKQYETVFDILAKQLLHQDMYLQKDSARNLMDIVTNLDPAIIGFAIFHPNGVDYVTMSSLDRTEPSLLEIEETRESFIQTLKSSHMELGRTYRIPELDKVIVPLRTAVRNTEGEVIFVLSLIIDPDLGFEFFFKNDSVHPEYITYLYRERDRYFQLASPYTLSSGVDILNYQVTEAAINEAFTQLAKQTGIPLETIREEQLVVSNINNSAREERLFSSTYLKRYGLWVSTDIPTSIIQQKILYKSSILVAIFFVALLVIYRLVRGIHNIESKKQDELLYQASHDYVTNLHNRLYLEKFCNIDEKNKSFWLLLIDMDNFNTINASHGHESGDQTLIMISNRLQALIGGDELLIRYGGNEFIIVTHKTNIEDVKAFCDEILVSLRQPYSFDWGEFILTASIGVAHYPSDGQSLEEIRRYADLAMHESKKTRNTTIYFKDSIKERVLYDSELGQELKYGLERNEFYMLYQPKVNAQGVIKGVEALVRWQNQALGFVGPDKFIPIAESTGDMVAIGDFVIDKSLADIAAFNCHSDTPLVLSVNISVKQFLHPDFIEKLTHSLQSANFEPCNLIIEITETLFIEDIFGINETLAQVKRLGVQISLDDFGTGYSSLNLLTKLPIDELKIDKSFVDDILVDANAKSMAEGIIAIGKKLDLIVVAEGVETIGQLSELVDMGCDIYQGYYFAKPLSVDDLEAFCAAKAVL